MNSIVKFEMKKFFRNKKNIISIIIFTFLIIFFIGYSSFMGSLAKTSEIDIHKENYINAKENYNTVKNILEDLKNKNEVCLHFADPLLSKISIAAQTSSVV